MTIPPAALLKRKQQANRWALVSKDAWAASDYLRGIAWVDRLDVVSRPPTADQMREGLLIASITAYCRGFLESDSLPHAMPRATIEKLPVGREPEFRSLHDAVLAKRNQCVAHAAWSHHKTEQIAFEPGGYARQYPYPGYSTGISLAHLMALIRRVRYEANDRAMWLDGVGERPGRRELTQTNEERFWMGLPELPGSIL